MFINPKEAISQGWIQGIRNLDKQVQPNAIDFTFDELRPLLIHSGSNSPLIGETSKRMTELGHSISPRDIEPGISGWSLSEGTYDVTSQVYVNLPEGVAALLVSRSTFVRNGLFFLSGLYDSGFQGHIGGVLHVRIPYVTIEAGVRIGQIIFVRSDSAGLYAGGWNHDQGTHYTSKGMSPTQANS